MVWRCTAQVSGGKDLSFSDCVFSHLGSAYALSVVDGSKSVTVTTSTFTDLSGGFLKLGSVGADNTNPDEAGWDEGFTVTHNVAQVAILPLCCSFSRFVLFVFVRSAFFWSWFFPFVLVLLLLPCFLFPFFGFKCSYAQLWIGVQ
jgi:hypothetical protein